MLWKQWQFFALPPPAPSSLLDLSASPHLYWPGRAFCQQLRCHDLCQNKVHWDVCFNLRGGVLGCGLVGAVCHELILGSASSNHCQQLAHTNNLHTYFLGRKPHQKCSTNRSANKRPNHKPTIAEHSG